MQAFIISAQHYVRILTARLMRFLMTLQQVRGDNVDDPTTYLVSFDDAEARYVVFISLVSLNNPVEFTYVFMACSRFRNLLICSISIVATSYKACS